MVSTAKLSMPMKRLLPELQNVIYSTNDKTKLVIMLLNYKDDSQNNVFYTVKY